MASQEPYVYKRMPLTKYCFLPTCEKNTLLTPQKNFFCVPAGNRKEWCRAAGRYAPNGTLYICEDHLDLEEDMENYMYWKMMNVNARLKARLPAALKKPLTASNEHIHPKPSSSTNNALKRHLPTVLESDIAEPSTSSKNVKRHLTAVLKEPLTSNISESSSSSKNPVPSVCSVGITCTPVTATRQVQVIVPRADKTTNCCLRKRVRISDKYDQTVSLSDSSQTPSQGGSTFEVLEEDSSSDNAPTEKSNFIGRSHMLRIVNNKPMKYLGLPKEYYWIIDYLASNCDNVTSLGIITTLYRIRSDDTFSKISDLFELSLATLWRTYFPSLTVLSKFLKQFVYWPPARVIKQNLPDAFKIHQKYAQIQAIIDCFEVQIQQPSNPVEQSLSWSQYKGCNTAKFLISATPDGFINYISSGYGGRMSDIALVEQCGFIDQIPSNCTILADRGFKHLESTLSAKGIKLLRPPSVYSNTKLTKEEVLNTKVIASLRVHIERVIRRVRLYMLLKPHSTVNNKLTNTLDHVVQIACGLINLQSPIINNN